MSIDLNNLFGQAADAAKQGMNDLLQTAGNAGLGYLEQQGATALQDMANGSASAAQTATTSILNRPGGDPTGFGAYFSNLIQSPVLKQYGPELMLGVAAIAVVAIVLTRR